MTQALLLEITKFFPLIKSFALLDKIHYSQKAFVEEPHNEDIRQLDMYHSHSYSSSRVCTTDIKPLEQPRIWRFCAKF